MTDQELIRKGAEAILIEYMAQMREALHNHVNINPIFFPHPCPFDELPKSCQNMFLKVSNSALNVFYEHTRTQPREGGGVICKDCGHAMTPAKAMLGTWYCTNCGGGE